MKELTDEQFDELKSHSLMLSRISAYVEDFCRSEEDTTLVGVLRLLSEYHSLKADSMYDRLEAEKEKQK